MARILAAAVLTAMLGATIGCGSRAPDMPDLGTVSGTITLDGKPLAGVSIYFKPEVGRPSIATSDDSGAYEAFYLIDAKGVKLGPCTVTVEWGPDEAGPTIPAKYGYESEVTFDVQPGSNPWNIEMKSS